ncbi:uncharacterized protein EV420DRAFT_1551458 [Desarmillaria tabescens]|uniref:Uncharacterized protein n=1 Tax=Armillaria tabescens TaxID=1929756 RepID=A0AA39K9X9_ARMTA|nr:uncharacterized protein EV420DRAFT_1551458 [Desarmillaria tabescens]KAK0457107.1 hypothetical protein EV420DRAFT_1551458 [Desarmillaria tabescens]
MARPSSKSTDDQQNSPPLHGRVTTILRQPIVSITGDARDWVYLGLIVGATILLCYVANLIFQLLKPISDLISSTSTGISTICSGIGSGIEASIDGVAAGFTSLLSTVIPPMLGFKCFIVSCDLSMPYLPSEESKVLFFHTTNLTVRLKHEAQEILNLHGHIQILSEGAMLDVISENSATFSDLSRRTAYGSQLPISLRYAISDRFASLARLSRLLERAFIASRRAGHNTKVTFLREVNSLEHVLDPIWIYPTSSRDSTLRKQLGKSQGSVDFTLDKLKKAVREAVNITSLLNKELDNFDLFLRDQSSLLETNQTHVQWFLTLVGISKGLQENRDRMMFLAFNVHEAQERFMGIGTCCENIHEASEELKVWLFLQLNPMSNHVIRKNSRKSHHQMYQIWARTVLQLLFERLFGRTSRNLGRRQPRTVTLFLTL